MKLLLSCFNSPYSLIGYDWEQRKVFFKCPSFYVKLYGISYHLKDLLIANDNCLLRLSPNAIISTQINSYRNAVAHSVKSIDNNIVGVIDTGNSTLVQIDEKGEKISSLEILKHWDFVPHDAIHLNDFVVTPYGILTSCFDYRPWRKVEQDVSWDKWCNAGYGLIINATGNELLGKGAIIGSGFNHPHSLNYIDPYLYFCASSTGTFHVCEFTKKGILRELKNYQITKDHFLRGAYKIESGWFLGGSAVRHGSVLPETIELYFLNEKLETIEKQSIDEIEGEIYDILPWNDEIMTPIVNKYFQEPIMKNKIIADFITDSYESNSHSLEISLSEINLIIFPQWSREKKALTNELKKIIKAIGLHSQRDLITLVVDADTQKEEDLSNLFRDIYLDILAEKKIEYKPKITILKVLNQQLFLKTLSKIKVRIILENEEKSKAMLTIDIPSMTLDMLRTWQFL